MEQTVYFKNIRSVIIEYLETSEREILIAVAWFTDQAIINILEKKIKEGVRIYIIFFDDKINNKNYFEKLYYDGAIIKVSKKLMHHKFAIIDKNIVISGSYNWTNNASNNIENIQVIKNNNKFIEEFTEEFFLIDKNCTSLDNYFKVSINTVKEINLNFDNTLHIPNTEYPYFFKDYIQVDEEKRLFQTQKKTIKSLVFFLIRNISDKYSILKYKHLIDKGYSNLEIQNYFNLQLNLIYFNDVLNIPNLNKIEVDEIIVLNNTDNSYYALKENKNYSFEMFKINKNGLLQGEKIIIKQIIENNYLSVDNIVYNSNLEIIFNKSPVIKIINKIGLLTRNINYGLYSFNGEIIIPETFCTYHIQNNKEKIELHLIEYPKLFFQKKHLGGIMNIEKFESLSFIYKHISYPTIEKWIDEELNIETKKINHRDFDPNGINGGFYFIFESEDNRKYSDLYQKILNFDLGKISYEKFIERKKTLS